MFANQNWHQTYQLPDIEVIEIIEGLQMHGAASSVESNATIEDAVQTTDDAWTDIFTHALKNNTSSHLEIKYTAQSSPVGESFTAKLRIGLKNVNGVVSKINGASDDTLMFKDVVTWDVRTVTSGNQIIAQVKGEAGKTIDWKSSHKILYV